MASATLSARAVHDVLQRLVTAEAGTHDEIASQYLVCERRRLLDEDDDNDRSSDSPILDAYMKQGGSEAIVTLANFTLTEFLGVFSYVETDLATAWTTGKGRKSTTTPKDALLATLTVLKHYQTWDKHALDFNYKSPTFEKMVHRVIDICSPVSYQLLVVPTSMAQQRAHKTTSANYLYAL